MKTIEYQELLAQIAPLDTDTLTKLEADLTQMLKQRQAKMPGERHSMKDLMVLAGKSLEGRDEAAYWTEREKELDDSRASWAERENERYGALRP